jgi:ubiquinone/menaquinone biosynthesis C-methylase UbiE
MRPIRNLWWGLIRFGFRLLYHELAFTYDLVSRGVSLGAWRCWQRAALKHIRHDGLTLELAHGTGDLQLDFARAGCRAIGYDLSPQMGRIARQKLLRHKITPRLTRGAAQALPFPDGQFSAVVSTFPSDFIAAKETLAEVYRVLRADGVFVIVPSATFTGGGAAKTLLEWLYRITGQQTAQAAPDDSRIHDWLSPCGFEVSIQREPCRNSVALVIVARKKGANSL